jgi:hypothetical protein
MEGDEFRDLLSSYTILPNKAQLIFQNWPSKN